MSTFAAAIRSPITGTAANTAATKIAAISPAESAANTTVGKCGADRAESG